MIDGIDPDQIHIGMKVKAVWKPASEREGAITDIRYFAPLHKPAARKAAGKAGRRTARGSRKK
jgi:hypothetical protein